MTLRARQIGLALALCGGASSVFALGFGNLPTEAVLGQPLRLAIPLRLEPSEDVPIDCLAAQVYFADTLQLPGNTSIRLLPAAPGDVNRTLSLTTTTRVDEPFVSVEVTVGCQARVSRRFTLFADPPMVVPAPATLAAAPVPPPFVVPPAPAAAPPAVQSTASPIGSPMAPSASDTDEAARTAMAPSPGSAAALPSDTAAAPAVAPRRNIAPRVTASAPRPPRPTPRRTEVASPALKLAPLERSARAGSVAAAPTAPTAPITPGAAAPPPAPPLASASTAPPAAASAAANRALAAAASAAPTPLSAPAAGAAAAATSATTSAAASALAAEQAASAQAALAQARVAELEASLEKLRADNARVQNVVTGLQARLSRAQGDPASNTLVYALAAALAVMLGAVLWLWRQRYADREAQSWLVAHAASAAGPLDATETATTAQAAAFAPVPTLKTWVSKPNDVDGFDDTLALTRAGIARSTQPAPFRTEPAPLAGAQPLTADAQKREVSVEELIDLEQQAEFFVVLGQDSAAIDLLMGHLRSTSGTSPLPYLKLLEIYRRLGERDDYERLRERFNRRFNAYAPSWETDLLGGRSLEDYPAVIERLQSLWVMPQRAREVLQATLVRPETSGTDPVGDDSFDLPAYRELMLLYSVARDVSELEASASDVDLMLPIGEDDAPTMAPRLDTGNAAAFERLLATTNLPAQPDLQKPLEMDLALDLEPASSDAVPPSSTFGRAS